jgi:hypothetical protein
MSGSLQLQIALFARRAWVRLRRRSEGQTFLRRLIRGLGNTDPKLLRAVETDLDLI